MGDSSGSTSAEYTVASHQLSRCSCLLDTQLNIQVEITSIGRLSTFGIAYLRFSLCGRLGTRTGHYIAQRLTTATLTSYKCVDISTAIMVNFCADWTPNHNPFLVLEFSPDHRVPPSWPGEKRFDLWYRPRLYALNLLMNAPCSPRQRRQASTAIGRLIVTIPSVYSETNLPKLKNI